VRASLGLALFLAAQKDPRDKVLDAKVTAEGASFKPTAPAALDMIGKLAAVDSRPSLTKVLAFGHVKLA
jgi:hypothetical protein